MSQQPQDDHVPGRLRPSGGYRDLRAFQTTTVIHDATVAFCENFIRSHKLADQLIGAARSGRKNIGEGSRASATSAESELKLVNVARASQDELLMDYEDHLRQKKHRQWHKNDPEAMEVRIIGKRPDDVVLTYAEYARWLDHEHPSQRANCLICLIHQANFLLDRSHAWSRTSSRRVDTGSSLRPQGWPNVISSKAARSCLLPKHRTALSAARSCG